jgi:catechol 2,3-dioxygenase-like lactoylglutathione lyase family enzyme
MLKHPDHVTVAVTDPAAAIGFFVLLGFEHHKVTAAGVCLRNQPMTFHDRKLVFLEGTEGITVELVERK